MITGYGATIVDGAWLTLQLALLSMLLAIVLGLLGAAFRLSPVRWLAWCGDLYATVVRGIPVMRHAWALYPVPGDAPQPGFLPGAGLGTLCR